MSGKAPCQQIMVRGGVIGQREAALTETVARLQRARRHLVPIQRASKPTLLKLLAPDLPVLHADGVSYTSDRLNERPEKLNEQPEKLNEHPQIWTPTHLFRNIITCLEAFALLKERVHAADRVHVGLPHGVVLREGEVEEGVELGMRVGSVRREWHEDTAGKLRRTFI